MDRRAMSRGTEYGKGRRMVWGQSHILGGLCTWGQRCIPKKLFGYINADLGAIPEEWSGNGIGGIPYKGDDWSQDWSNKHGLMEGEEKRNVGNILGMTTCRSRQRKAYVLKDGEGGVGRMNNQKSRFQEAEGTDVLRRAEDVHQGSPGKPRGLNWGPKEASVIF